MQSNLQTCFRRSTCNKYVAEMAGSSSVMGCCTDNYHYRRDKSMIRSRTGLWEALMDATGSYEHTQRQNPMAVCVSKWPSRGIGTDDELSRYIGLFVVPEGHKRVCQML